MSKDAYRFVYSVFMVERTCKSCITTDFERMEATHIGLVVQDFEQFWLRSGTTNEVVLLRCFLNEKCLGKIGMVSSVGTSLVGRHTLENFHATPPRGR